jgi:hypothetical protein
VFQNKGGKVQVFLNEIKKSKLSLERNQERSLHTTSFYAGFLLGLFFDPEDGDMFLRNVG